MGNVRIGFIGVGGMAEHHIKKLQKIGHAELTAVYDANPARMNEIAERYGAAPFGSADELLDSGAIDALFLCTPQFTRGAVEKKAAANGIHLFAEKPIGLDLEQARTNSRLILESGIIHAVGYCLRYLETVQKAKAYLADKTPDMVLAYRIGSLPPVRWFHQMEQSGGQLVDQSTHQVDLVRYVAGEFRDVQARYAQRSIRNEAPDATIPDVGVVSFSLQSGAIGTINTGCMSRRFGRAEVEVIGPDFYVSLDGNGTSLTIVDDQQNISEKCGTDFYFEQDRAFVEAVRTGRQELVRCGFDDALATLEVTLAANESARTGRQVAIGASKAAV
ncbi:hypothetical protein PACILC2_05830 [Paenibacillus cisolokensis]|uniref:Oxidoreductase n=1 Tax=Paenibacillus cisolokensis TaxID=1658519 RepID=A0ABQ4N1F7_9BACL|nr:Gfo/Idh/MocA family oxidoreductase [Paenibacillus cisolokensis]GIQ62015.1 hypothetical protein PACILC2_05830 [Paenibacillus cisolokensis]